LVKHCRFTIADFQLVLSIGNWQLAIENGVVTND